MPGVLAPVADASHAEPTVATPQDVTRTGASSSAACCSTGTGAEGAQNSSTENDRKRRRTPPRRHGVSRCRHKPALRLGRKTRSPWSRLAPSSHETSHIARLPNGQLLARESPNGPPTTPATLRVQAFAEARDDPPAASARRSQASLAQATSVPLHVSSALQAPDPGACEHQCMPLRMGERALGI